MNKDTCRILPTFLVDKYEEFFLLPPLGRVPKHLDAYVQRLKIRLLEYYL
jgi:hypothetical protein